MNKADGMTKRRKSKNPKQNEDHNAIVDYLKKHPEKLEDNLVLYYHNGITNEPNDKIKLVPELDMSEIKTDFCCFNDNDSSIVVVEVKSLSANYHALCQIKYYMRAARDLKYIDGKEVKAVRGIILAHKISKSLKTAIKEEYKSKPINISLKIYKWIDGELDIKEAR